ncbi:MAG: hypothetical protein GXP62_20175 [Oligoflexia bacterium]|nr:hypothetical protein [Oligoflexia bacterium]
MRPLPADLAALLAAPDAAPDIDLPRPSDPIGHGLMAPAKLDLQHMRAPPVPVAMADCPLGLWRLVDHGGDLVLDPPAAVSVLRGRPWVLEDDGLLLRSDKEAITLQAEGWLVDIDAGRVRAWRLPPETGPSLPPRPQFTLHVPPWPGLDTLLGGRSCAPWLADRVTHRGQAADPLARLAGAGLLARLWEPASSHERSQAIADLVAGRPQPQTAIRSWLVDLNSLPALAAARGRADSLSDALTDLEKLAIRAPQDAPEAARHVVEDRDDLASISVAIRLSGTDPSTLEYALQDVDQAVSVHGSLLSELLRIDPDDPWLRAVSRQEPEHWWGALLR